MKKGGEYVRLSDQEVVAYFGTLQSVADHVVHEMEEEYKSELEPFEQYAARLRHSIYQNFSSYQENFVEGYRVLLSEIEREEGSCGT